VRPIVAALAAVILLTGCGGSDDDQAPSPTSTLPAASPSPAQTAVATSSGPPAEHGYRAAEVFPQLDFERMLGLIAIPGAGGDAVVLTQDGVIYRTTLASDAEPSVFLDLSEKIIPDRGNEEGLLGLAFAPDYAAAGGEVYIYYTAGDPRRSVISRFDATAAADPASEHVVLEVPQPFANHNGGQMVFGPDDGMLYIALGDGGSRGDPQGNGQNTNVILGKILRIDVSGDTYTIPPDNPFAQGGGRGEVWAYGLRNPWRFTFDRETGDIWAGDVGQNAFEEIDRIERGGNYGWNILEGNSCFATDDCSTEGLIAPRAVYGREGGNCSVTGGYVYRGASMPELNGWYVYGDFCSGRVWALNTADNSDPIVLMDSEKAISSFAEDTDGELYLVTFNNAIYRLDRE
jgi:glucose/arabinose dehydrogenase